MRTKFNDKLTKNHRPCTLKVVDRKIIIQTARLTYIATCVTWCKEIISHYENNYGSLYVISNTSLCLQLLLLRGPRCPEHNFISQITTVYDFTKCRTKAEVMEALL